MMRFVAVVGCLTVAVDAYGRAIGRLSDPVLTADYLWINWFVMASFLMSAGLIAFKGTDQ